MVHHKIYDFLFMNEKELEFMAEFQLMAQINLFVGADDDKKCFFLSWKRVCRSESKKRLFIKIFQKMIILIQRRMKCRTINPWEPFHSQRQFFFSLSPYSYAYFVKHLSEQKSRLLTISDLRRWKQMAEKNTPNHRSHFP